MYPCRARASLDSQIEEHQKKRKGAMLDYFQGHESRSPLIHNRLYFHFVFVGRKLKKKYFEIFFQMILAWLGYVTLNDDCQRVERNQCVLTSRLDTATR